MPQPFLKGQIIFYFFLTLLNLNSFVPGRLEFGSKPKIYEIRVFKLRVGEGGESFEGLLPCGME